MKLFPQGYAAILQHSDLLNEPSVILADIGGWTVDIMRLDNRIDVYKRQAYERTTGKIRGITDASATKTAMSLPILFTLTARKAPFQMKLMKPTQAWIAESGI